MAENTSGKDPSETGQLPDLRDPSSVRETVRRADFAGIAAHEVGPVASARKDPRADPDDEPISARIDVVTVERGGGGGGGAAGGGPVDSLTNAALSLRRELAKLHQQAAAVERTIEDQRRERSDALERVEFATARVAELEQKLELAEAEIASSRRIQESAIIDLQKVRSERDDLLRAIESAKVAADELSKARVEVETLREAHVEALRAASTYEAELGEIRKREQAGAQKVSDTEVELSSLRERLERTTAELVAAREETTATKSETARFRQEVNTTNETMAKLREETERERSNAKEQLESIERTLGETRAREREVEEKLGAAEGDLGALRLEVAQSFSDIARLERDLEAARHARDVSSERASMAERETKDIRKDVERLQRELEAAVLAASQAQTRAAAAERVKTSVEEGVRQLRDEVTTAFARFRTSSPSNPPPPSSPPSPQRGGSDSVAPPTRVMPPSLQDRAFDEAPNPTEPQDKVWNPPATKRGVVDPETEKQGQLSREREQDAEREQEAEREHEQQEREQERQEEEEREDDENDEKEPSDHALPIATKEARPLSEPSIQVTPAPEIDLNLTDDDWPSPSNPPPAEVRTTTTTASEPPRAGGKGSTTTTTKTSAALAAAAAAVRDSSHPRPRTDAGGSISPLTPRSVPPPLPSRSRPPPLPPPRRPTIPPAVYPSVPPPGPIHSSVPTAPPPNAQRREEGLGSGLKVLSDDRDELLSMLSDLDTGRAAAMALRSHSEWLKGRPPVELLEALAHLDYDVDHPIFELARAWERETLCRSLIHGLREETDAKLREHGAWLLKHLGSPVVWPIMSDLVRNEDEPILVRRWLLEAIERLVASRQIGWADVGNLVELMVRHPDPSLRDGVIGVIAALDRSDGAAQHERKRLLLELLRTDDDEIVLASAVHALASVLPIELDPAVAERLLGHSSARVQRSVVDFIERSKRVGKMG